MQGAIVEARRVPRGEGGRWVGRNEEGGRSLVGRFQRGGRAGVRGVGTSWTGRARRGHLLLSQGRVLEGEEGRRKTTPSLG